jgi:hypothetical protein
VQAALSFRLSDCLQRVNTLLLLAKLDHDVDAGAGTSPFSWKRATIAFGVAVSWLSGSGVLGAVILFDVAGSWCVVKAQ